jgi:diguanylate cyclase (GGDEF)-like protein
MRPLSSPSVPGAKLICALLLLCAFALLCADLYQDDVQRRIDLQKQTENISGRLADQLNTELRETDLVLDYLNESPLTRRLVSGESIEMDQQQQLSDHLHSQLLRLPFIGQVLIADSDCTVVFSSQNQTGQSLRQSDVCQWLLHPSLRPESRFTEAASRNEAKGILHAVKLLNGQHQPMGMLIGLIPAPSVQAAISGFAVGAGSEILLQDRKHSLIGSFPAISMNGEISKLDDLARALLRIEGQQQSFYGNSVLNGMPHLYSTRTLEEYPLKITVGVSTEALNRTLIFQSVVYLLAWILLAALALLATRGHLRSLRQDQLLLENAQQLHETHEQIQTILTTVPVAIVLVDHEDQNIVYANGLANTMLDLGTRFDSLPDIDGSMRIQHFTISPLSDWLRAGRTMENQEIEIERANRTREWVRVTMRPIQYKGKVTSLIALQDRHDIKEQEHLVAQLRSQLDTLTRTDTLTQLYNRTFAEQELVNEVSRCQRYGHSLSLACFDIDHFRQFNERYGRQAGDNVLIAVANELVDSTRTTDVCARISGEEFMVIFTNTPLKYAYKVMDRIHSKIASTIFPFAEDNVTFSGGVTSWRLGDTAEDLEKRAETMMQQAKENGRNRLLTDEDLV